jgi:hypothetical protein
MSKGSKNVTGNLHLLIISNVSPEMKFDFIKDYFNLL